jgi:hypothetical protein
VFGWELELRFGSEPAYERLREPRWWPRPDDAYAPTEPLGWELPMTKLIGRVPGADLHAVLEIAREIAGADAVATSRQAFVEPPPASGRIRRCRAAAESTSPPRSWRSAIS